MRKNRNKIILIAITVGLALYFLYPTYKDYELHKSLSQLQGEDSLQFAEQNEAEIRDSRLRRIKLGLDLKGGMRVVLEVNVLKLLEDLAKNKDDLFAKTMKEVRDESALSEESPVLLLRSNFEAKQIRLSKYYLTLRATNDEVASFLEEESQKAIDRAIEIVRNRVDQYGVSEPSIQKLGGTRIIVELPGVSKEAEVRQLLQGTALLEFKLLKDEELTYKVMESIDNAMAAAGGIDTTDTAATFASTDTTTIATPEGELTPEEFA